MKSRKTNLGAVDPGDSDDHKLYSATDRPAGGKRPHKPEIRLGREAQARIGELLRTMYNAYVNQGVPPHLEELVRRLGQQELGEQG